MKKVLIAAAGAMAFASVAQAADLPYRKEAPAPYDYAPTFTWTGLYLGVNAGLGLGGFDGGQRYFGKSPIGGLYGFTGGYNYQQGKLVVGAEADFDFGHVADSATPGPYASSTGVVENFFSARARVGYAMDRALFYGTGGYAGANVRGALSGNGLGFDQSHIANGWALGVGMEYAITPHFSVKGEYLYASMGDNKFFGAPNTVSNSVDLSVLRAGVNYHF
ncbi:outer membrane immunogenic protein [Rhodoblastus acidophilus]|uniref:Outer membrane immunogenic protein n=1 Tax=Rhodoblastus acidophilus TaxID=1074 RepID=A0A212RWD3_RHOAC|nr:outer membrane protein [Rhodoblastus acidophilus]MCW2315185.1 outer membrane immunogenic protein [Rhodoblastus acidophilus]PPQ38369.1 porin family protein [Rhodoblastus acidophilus]RAI20042.1 porin family protein [Rhodoblastus acidophilus]SNB76997.1 outer membrane immunogenic protein [Rhodoblastus acidophilus]